MKVYILTLVLLCETLAYEDLLGHCDVGTVLFHRSAVTQSTWSAPEIGLLRARKHFLDIIPPVHALNTRSEDFTNSMLAYFKETFQVVNNEATDKETNTLLKLALCDTIGGYLKMWILPVTKFAYYGGSVPKEDAMKLYELHKYIKRYLNTDGKGWRNPKASFLYSMSVNIAPLRHDMTRKSDNPCDEIAYFKKTGSGLAIPVPSISWEPGSECMFLPIKDLGPAPLNVPESSNKLYHYYNTAKHCVESSGIESLDSYDERLQKWLDDDVVTHLSDERLFPALYSILSLVNKSRNLCDIIEDPTVTYNSRNKTHVAGIPLDLSSKKMMVITVIIILEIAWCIPTLCYLMCSRIKKKKMQSDSMCYNIETVHRRDGDNFQGQARDSSPSVTTTSIDKPVSRGPSKLISVVASRHSQACIPTIKSHDVNVEACVPKSSEHSIGTTTHSEFACQLHPVQIKTQDKSVSRTTSKQFSAPLATTSTPDNISIDNTEKTPMTRACWKRSVYSSTPSKVSDTSLVAPIGLVKKSKTCKCDCRNPSSCNIILCGSECGSQSCFIKTCKCDCESSTSFVKSCCGPSRKLSLHEVKAYRVDPKKTISPLHKKNCSKSNCDCFKSIPEEELVSGSGSTVTTQNLQPSQTVTLLHGRIASTVKHIETYTEYDKNEKKVDCKASKKNVTIADESLKTIQLKREASRSMSKEVQSIAIEKSSKQTMKYAASKSSRTTSESETKCGKKDTKCGDKALLEVTIDRQHRALLGKQSLSCAPESPVKIVKRKPSKIPKRFLASSVTQTLFQSRNKPESNRRSLIPQPKRQLTVDDIVIQSSNPSRTGLDRLNVTL